MKATDLLKQQHVEVKKLFRRLEQVEDAAGRQEIVAAIVDSLHGHMLLEEEVFYPAVREVTTKATEMVSEAFEEHHAIELLLDELPEVDPADERFKAKMTVLEEVIDHHVSEEEREMFKVAKKLGEDVLERLGKQMADDVDLEELEEGDEGESGDYEYEDATELESEGNDNRARARGRGAGSGQR